MPFPSFAQRPTLRDKHRISPLPSFSNATHDKHPLTGRPIGWTTTLVIPLPGRRFNLVLPIPQRISQYVFSRYGPRNAAGILIFGLLVVLWILFALGKRFGSSSKQWPQPFQSEPPTLVFGREDLRRVWEWEIASGHYPSNRRIPEEIGLTSLLSNPGLPPPRLTGTWNLPAAVARKGGFTIGSGAARTYFHVRKEGDPPDVSYPPRPIPGSVADLDVVMDYCDFSTQKYVRDCLEVMRIGAGLDNGKRVRRGNMDAWHYIFTEHNYTQQYFPTRLREGPPSFDEDDVNAGLVFQRRAALEPHLRLPPPTVPVPYSSLSNPCDSEYPRIYHMFWAGPFTDKPYLALLSFLFTQNVDLHHRKDTAPPSNVCRPQFWVWINPGPAASVPNPDAWNDMYASLKANPWSSPFLHPRFENIIKIKMWNTTEQLDGVPEIKDEWRTVEQLLNSGGHKYGIKVPESESASSSFSSDATTDTPLPPESLSLRPTSEHAPQPSKIEKKKDSNDLYDRLGSTSQQDYDRLSVILSDMARFVLCHRFGGIYLDADTILLRDWEELWGWKGAFAYRWSRLEKYNTAVLKMNKGSALGSFLFRTALRNGLDFHPMTVSRYMKDAYLEGLLLRLPDALFDSAWLNVEWYQRDRPAFPYFTDFHDLFLSAAIDGAGPQILGFEGFFRGAFSYHFHNFWWEPFDSARNWPDLGERFIEGERQARHALKVRLRAQDAHPLKEKPYETDFLIREDDVSEDTKDLSWAVVLKRTFESYIRGEKPNMYGEWISW